MVSSIIRRLKTKSKRKIKYYIFKGKDGKWYDVYIGQLKSGEYVVDVYTYGRKKWIAREFFLEEPSVVQLRKFVDRVTGKKKSRDTKSKKSKKRYGKKKKK